MDVEGVGTGVGTGLNDCDDDVECVVREYATSGSESGDRGWPMRRLVTVTASPGSAVGLVAAAVMEWLRCIGVGGG